MQENKVDITKIDLERDRDKIATLPGLLDYAHTVGGAVIKPEDKGKIRGVAVTAMHNQTDRQFRQLQEQMARLIDQAKYLHKRVEISERIYEADMGFDPVYNQVYFLYRRKSGEDVLSMVSPEEWNGRIPYASFLAEVRLLADHTWELVRTNDEEFYS